MASSLSLLAMTARGENITALPYTQGNRSTHFRDADASNNVEEISSGLRLFVKYIFFEKILQKFTQVYMVELIASRSQSYIVRHDAT